MSIAAIHILKHELRLGDAEYRNLLYDVAGVASSKQLSDDADRAVMRALYDLRDRRKQAAAARPKSPMERKLWALWFSLKAYLPEREQTSAYLLGFVNRASGAGARSCSEFGGLAPVQLHRAIEALKARIEQEQERIAQEVPF